MFKKILCATVLLTLLTPIFVFGEITSSSTELIQAVRNKNLKKVQALLKQGTNVNGQDVSGATALMWAIPYGNAELIQLLLHYKADPRIKDRQERTPFLWAARYGDLEGATLIFPYIESIEEKNGDGNTALMLASFF